MKKILNSSLNKALIIFLTTIIMVGCEEDIPGAGSIEDETPPTAGFSYAPDVSFNQIQFTNESVSATDYIWSYGDGETSTEFEEVHEYAGEGTYTVTLTASDKLDASNSVSMDVVVVDNVPPFVPVIEAAGFNDGDDNALTKDFWRNGDLGGVIQISSSSSFVGGFSSKYPSDNSRIAYQEIVVEADTDYTLSYDYSIEGQGDGISVTVMVLGVTDNGGTLDDEAQISGATLASHVGENGTGKSNFTSVDIPFNSGTNTTIAIYVENAGSEVAYVDEFTIVGN